MKKYELDGEVYYYINNQYVDSRFVVVDECTRIKIIEKIKQKIDHENDKPKSEIYIKNNTTPKENPYYVDREIVKKTQRTANMSSAIGSDLSVPKLSEFNISEQDLQNFEIKMQRYHESLDIYRKQKAEYDKKREHAFTIAGFIIFPGVLFTFCLLGALSSFENVNFWTFALGLIINVVIAYIYYKCKAPNKVLEINRKEYISDELYTKVEKYNYALARYKEMKKRTSRLYWDSLDGYGFEKAVATLFNSLGAETLITPKSGDHGIDVIAKYKGKTYAIQCKHHNNPVGPAPVRELRGVVEGEYDRGIFVSLNGYTQSVKQENYSAIKKIILLDREKLIKIAEQQDIEKFLK